MIHFQYYRIIAIIYYIPNLIRIFPIIMGSIIYYIAKNI